MLFDSYADFGYQIVYLVLGWPDLDRWIKQARWSNYLLSRVRTTAKLINSGGSTYIYNLVYMALKLSKGQWAVI